VVLVPGFLSTDFYMTQFYGWLRRLGYRPYFSGISFNAECPNLLIRQYLTTAIQSAYKSTARRVHVIGHSLGGTMARAIAAQMPDRIASIITLAAPIHGVAGHAAVLRVAQMVRKKILERHGRKVLPDCYTARCTCDFLLAIRGEFPKSVRQTAIYSKCDGIVDWRVCRTGNRHIDVEVSSTHLGLVCSPLVYQVVGERLAGR
jgi:pimeloyl-ACP methyl ester carboxylesterase